MTTPGNDTQAWAHRALNDVLSADVLCTSMINYLLAVYLARNDFAASLLERDFLDRRASNEWRQDTLRRVIAREGVDFNPYDALPDELKLLSDFRNRVAHSQADHGNPLRRLRRRRAENEPVWVISEAELAMQQERGMTCQSQLNFLTVRLIDGL